MKAFPRLHLPNPDRLIKRTRNNEIRLRIEIDAEHKIGMATQGFDAFTSGRTGVPDAESAVVGSGANVMGIGRPGEIGDAFGVADEAVAEGEGGGRPDD